MKVYTGKVKDGKIDVSEPDGATAVLIFDTVVKEDHRPEWMDVPMEKPEAPDVKPGVKDVEVKSDAVGKRMRFHNGRNNRHIYRAILGMSVREFVLQQKAAGFNGNKNDMVEKVRLEFVKAGYGSMWGRHKKIEVSVRASIAPFGFAYSRQTPIKAKAKAKAKVLSKTKAPRRIIDVHGLSRHAVWMDILGCGIKDYVTRKLSDGMTPIELIEDIGVKVEEKGYKANQNSIGAMVYIKARQSEYKNK